MSVTGYGTIENIPSAWPAGIQYNRASARYVYSTSNVFQIGALDHVHIVDIDLPQVGLSPNVMTLTLPVMANLPLGSRIYFFYVSQSNANDQLVFQPVTGSGNTVNGNAVSYTFVLSGNPELIVCIGVSENYILQSFGRNNPAPAPSYRSGLQSKMLYFVSPTPGSGLMTNFYGTTTGLKSMFYPNANAMDVLVPFGDQNISNFITRNVAVPTKGVYGFQVNAPGWYHVQLSLEAGIQWDSTSGQNTWADLAVCDSTGALTQHWRSADCCQTYFIGSTNYPTIMTNQYINFNAGDFLIFSYSGIGASIVSTIYTSASVTFLYYGPTNTSSPVPLPTTFEEFSLFEAVTSTNTDPELFAPISKALSGPKAASIQKAKKANAVSAALAQSIASSQVSAQPSFTLSDMERMINQALDARQVSSQASIVPIAQASSSSSSSSQPPPAKKRKALPASSSGEKEA